MKKDALFIFSEEQLGYSFSDTHPFNQKRILLTLDLLKKIWSHSTIAISLPLEWRRTKNYYLHMTEKFIDIVKKAGKGRIT